MVQWLNRITMSDEAAHLAYMGKLDEEVEFTYINVKTGKETTSTFSLGYAINLAESRREDRRYKNFEFHIG